ncbi:hypothetical protein GCM10009830_25510 [Glycomyces endophyticus]|uniref:DUF4178 domain-containing protein n=1 Tax=Glycomyces endophyticus TaxID=480996 RepID=A0ABN2GVD5_9ACTN
MESEQASVCALHGRGIAPQRLIGRRLVKITASWFWYEGVQTTAPLEVWLTDECQQSIRITTGSDWCLIFEASEPHEGCDTGEFGRVEVREGGDATPFAGHIGERILATREGFEPFTGRISLDLTFPTGGVRCDSWAGDLRLQHAPQVPSA